MNPTDLVADFPSPPGAEREALLYARLLLRYLADHVYTAQLSSGARVIGVTDFKRWLDELTAETRALLQKSALDARDRKCPICDHIHLSKDECGHYLSELKFCKCTDPQGVRA
ncbi:MAG TPA: hypothetical protein VE866_08370 [Candidatus Binatia bacterium]|jgi:hypothetical protein|nr:hypothetical protein [Candidatus Binatia bacterium]